jgi:hypothetical protein
MNENLIKEFRKNLYRNITILEKSIESFHDALRKDKFPETMIQQLSLIKTKVIEINMLAIEMEPPNSIVLAFMTLLSKIYPAVYISDHDEITNAAFYLTENMKLNQIGNDTNGTIN